MRKYGSGPAGAQPIGLGHASVRLPERILENVGDDNRFSAVHCGTARSRLRSDGEAVDGIGVALRKAGSSTVPHVLAVLIEEQDRAKQAGKLGFHDPHQLLQYFLQPSVAGYHLQNTALSVTQRLGLLALGNVHHGAHELLHIPGCVQNRMANGVSVFDSPVRKNDSVFPFVVRFFTDCSIGYLSPLGSILRMHALQPFFPSRQALFWIKAIYAIPFLGEIHGVSSCYPPGPTPRMAEPLRFR